MKKHILKTRIVVIAITVVATTAFFFVVFRENNSDNASARQLVLQTQYQWYSLTHKEDFPVLPTTSYEEAQGVPVLVYHGITKLSDRFSMTQDQFTEQLFALKRAGYQTITPDQFVDFIKNNKPIPKKSFLLTFDDGRKDSYYGADPVLRFLGFKAVMFIATHQSLDQDRLNYYLSTDELSYMIGTGRWFIESHAKQDDGGFIVINKDGTTGNFLSNLKWLSDKNRLETVTEYTQRITGELISSRKQIEDTFHVQANLFSYPFSDYGTQSKNFKESVPLIHDIVAKTYTAAFHQIWPIDYGYLYNKQTEDASLLKRLEPSPTLSGLDLVAMLGRGEPKPLPFTDAFSSDSGWKRSWGETIVDTEHKKMTLSGGSKNNGAFTFLDGSSVWGNYFANVHLSATHNSDVSITARFADDNNYVDCFFSNGTVQIRNKHNGVATKLAVSKNNYVFSSANAFMGIAVSNTTVACTLNNHNVLQATIPRNTSPVAGGLGIGMWSNDKDGTVVVTNVDVSPINTSIQKTIAKLQDVHLAILAGEVTYAEKSDLPKEYPKYQQTSLSKIFSSIGLSNFLTKPVTDNLVTNSSLVDQVAGIPVGWNENTYGDTKASFSVNTNNRSLTTVVSDIVTGGQAGWYFDPIPVSSGEEYVISGDYTSDAPVLFVAEYKMNTGTYQKDRMSWLVQTASYVPVSGTIQVPDGAQEMTAYFMLENNGSVTVKNITVKKLPSGAFDQGMLTLNFDDGFATSYVDVFPLLKKLGLTATHYIVSDYVGYPRYMTASQILDLQTAGEEIGAHTTKHPRLTLLSEDDLIHEIFSSKKELESMGFSISTFDYPYGSVNNFVRAEAVKAGYMGARSTLRGFNTKNTDPFMLRDQHVEKSTQFAEIKAYIDQAITNKTWLVLEFHDTVSAEKGLNEAISPQLLSQILSYIKETNIHVVTMKQGITLMKE